MNKADGTWNTTSLTLSGGKFSRSSQVLVARRTDFDIYGMNMMIETRRMMISVTNSETIIINNVIEQKSFLYSHIEFILIPMNRKSEYIYGFFNICGDFY